MEPMNRTEPPPPYRPMRPMGGGSSTGLLVLGLVVAGLVGALGAYLLANGHLVVGGLLLAIAVVRVVMTALRWHRRRERQQRIEAWRAARRGPQAPWGPWGGAA